MDPLNKIPPSEKKHSWCVEKWFRWGRWIIPFLSIVSFWMKGALEKLIYKTDRKSDITSRKGFSIDSEEFFSKMVW